MIIFNQYENLDLVAKTFDITSTITHIKATETVVVSKSDDDKFKIQIGRFENGCFFINPELAKEAESLHIALSTYYSSDKHTGLNSILLEITEDMADDSGAYCLILDSIDDLGEHIAIETKVFNELISYINKITQTQENIVDLLAMPDEKDFDFESPKLGSNIFKEVDLDQWSAKNNKN
jgi:hypothetical protein